MAPVVCPDFEPRARSTDTEEDGCTKRELLSDGAFVAVNIGKLSHHHHHANEKECNTSPPLSVVKSLSRKGSLRNGERSNSTVTAAASVATTPQGDTNSTMGSEPADGTEKSPLMIHVAVDKEIIDAPHAAAIQTSSGGMRPRRLVSGRRALWLDPARRVLLVFATLSSMGTLLLLYFTLCMDKNMPDGDPNAR